MFELAINGGTPACENLIGYGHQLITEEDVQSVVDVLGSGFLTCGPVTTEFENNLKLVTGARYVTAVSNGTAALHVACLAADISENDEVIVSPITFAASANCVKYCGGVPVFADIDPDTWNIDPTSIREKITKKTKAIIAVDFGGVHIDSSEIRSICDEFDLVFIEDAAHSLGTKKQGIPVGSIADITTFSFHPVKTITTGEGGAVTTNNSDYARLITLFSKHGITRDVDQLYIKNEGAWYYEQLELGYNYRMSEIQAALGSSQLKRLNEFTMRRQKIVEIYNKAFDSVPELAYQLDASPTDTTRHLYVLRFDIASLGKSRKFIFDSLRAENVGVNVHYLPVYRLPYYLNNGYKFDCCPEANRYYEEAITIPLHCCMTDDDVENVIDAVMKVLKWCRAN